MTSEFQDLESRLKRLKPAPMGSIRAVPRVGRGMAWAAAAGVLVAAAIWHAQRLSDGEGRIQGRRIRSGEAVRCAAGNLLDLDLADGSRLTLQGGTEGVLGPGRGCGPVFRLTRGSLRCVVAHRDTRFEIATPLGLIVDLGTVFSVSLPEAGVLEVAVEEGKVQCEVGKRERTLGAGDFLAADAAGRVVCMMAVSSSREDLVREILKLGSEDFEVRQAAFRKLLAQGGGNPKEVLSALGAEGLTEDAEIREACDRLRAWIPLEARRQDALRLAGDDPGLKAACEALFGGFVPESDPDRYPPLPAGEGTVYGRLSPDIEGFVEHLTAFLEKAGTRAGAFTGPLATFLDHPNATVRLATVQALGGVGEKSAAPLVVRAILEDPDRDVRESAVRALPRVGAEGLVPRIVSGLKSPEALTRVSAVKALQVLKEKSAVPEIRPLLADPDAEVACSALDALAVFGDGDSVPAIRKLVGGHASHFVRAAAARALGSLGTKEAGGVLVPLLGEEDVGVRESAAEALARLGDRSVLGPIQALLKDPSPWRRAGGVLALGKLQDRDSAVLIRSLLGDPDREVRRAAIHYFESLGDASALPDLRKLLEDPEEWVREDAKAAIENLEAQKGAEGKP